MDIRKMLEQIIEILNGMDSKNSDIIALASLIIAILALFVTVIFNVITHRQYIESLAPVLSFELYERDSLLYLSVSNSGNSKAGNMHIQLLSIEGNGNEQLKKDNIYKGVIQLYPKESLNGQIAISGRNMETSIAPIVELSITYKRGNDNKTERYKRTVSYTEKKFCTTKMWCRDPRR